jgi:acetyltransferase
VVDDKYQGKGLGKKLLDMLIAVAEEKGLESIYGVVLPDNAGMINLAKNLGAIIKHEPEETIVEIKLG